MTGRRVAARRPSRPGSSAPAAARWPPPDTRSRRAARRAGQATTSTTSWSVASTSRAWARRPTRTRTRSSGTGRCFHAYHVARAAGWGDARYVDLVRELDDAVAAVDGHGFRITPLVRAPGLARGSRARPGRHRLGQGRDRQRRRARTRPATCSGSCWSCGSRRRVAGEDPAAAPGHRVLRQRGARRRGRRARGRARAARVRARRTRTRRCWRACTSWAPSWSPARAAPARPATPRTCACRRPSRSGAVPFTCQGPDDGLAIEGGATLAWEIADELRAAGATPRPDRRPGGRRRARVRASRSGSTTRPPWAPSAPSRGWTPSRPAARGRSRGPGSACWRTSASPRARRRTLSSSTRALRRVAQHRSRYMWPWETAPVSVAHGILDDETYDWLAVERAMLTHRRPCRSSSTRPTLRRRQRRRPRGHRHRRRRDRHRGRRGPARARRRRAPRAHRIRRGRPVGRPSSPHPDHARTDTVTNPSQEAR